jgi:hypothetical protein
MLELLLAVESAPYIHEPVVLGAHVAAGSIYAKEKLYDTVDGDEELDMLEICGAAAKPCLSRTVVNGEPDDGTRVAWGNQTGKRDCRMELAEVDATGVRSYSLAPSPLCELELLVVLLRVPAPYIETVPEASPPL